MNKHLYRIVFNHALGLFQVVSELVRRPGRGASQGDAADSSATVRPVSLSLWVAFGWIGLASVATAGQITTDPNAPGNQRPTVLGSPGAAPLVNITTPSKAGVSRNTYSNFNVDAPGVVLNNSRTNTTTQLAGTVAGNPWLATGTAKVILNEVTGSNPSALKGYIEVAGDRAQVIIANPAGISCDGCGVINANRFTLTTGTPVLSGGSLDGYRITGGSVQIGPNGMDASRADYTDIITRAVQVNGGIWSPQLQVTTGANQVNTDASQTTAIQGKGDKPTLALDVSALGGMYANKIILLGTEDGVGARNAGSIGASAGDLVVTMDGRLENTGTLQSQANTRINARGGVANSGTLSATRELSLSTSADLDNSGGELNAMRITVDAASLRNTGGNIAQTGSQGMMLDAGALSNRNGGRIGTTEADSGSGGGSAGTPSDGSTSGGSNGGSSGGISSGGDTGITPILPLADGALHIAGLLDNDGGRISAAAGFDLSSSTGLNNDGGDLSLRKLNLTSGNLSNRGGKLQIDGASTVHAKQINNDAGQLSFASAAAMDAQSLTNRSGTLTLAGTAPMTLNVASTLDNTDGTLATNAVQFTLNSGTLINERGTLNHTGSDGLSLTIGDWHGAGGSVVTTGGANISAASIDHRGATLSAAQITLNAANLDNRGGLITSAGDAANTLKVSGSLNNSDKGVIASNGDLAIAAANLGNAGGVIQQASTGQTGTLSIQAGTLSGHGGTLASNGALALHGDSLDLSQGSTYASTIAIQTGSLSTAGGSLQSFSADALNVRAIGLWDNQGGSVLTNGAMDVQAWALNNTGGILSAAGHGANTFAIAQRFNNTRGTLAMMGATTAQAGALINQGGTLQVSGAPLSLAASDLLDNSQQGLIASDGNLDLSAATLDNTKGSIQHAGNGNASIRAETLNGRAGKIVSNGSLSLTGNSTDLSGGVTQAQRIQVDTGNLSTAGGSLTALSGDALQLNVRNAFDNSAGTVATNGALQVSAQTLNNTGGTLSAAGHDATAITVTQRLDNTHGTLVAMGATAVKAGELINQGGTLQTVGAPLTVHADGLLDNRQKGLISSDGELTLSATTLDNTGGTIQQTGTSGLTIDATTFKGPGGMLISNGSLALSGDTLDLSGATTQAQHISVDAGSLSTAHGSLIALGGDPLKLNVRGAFDNTAGIVATNGALQVTAQSLTNTDGTLNAAGKAATTLSIAQRFDNTRGMLAAMGTTIVRAGDLINRGGTLQVSGAALSVTANGLLDNSDKGEIASDGDLSVSAATLDNISGKIEHAGSGNATITAATLNGHGGRLVSNGSLTLTGSTTDLSAGTTQAQRIRIDTGNLSTAGGSLLALGSDALQLNVRNRFDNNAGMVATNGALQLSAQTLTNRDGTLSAAGTDASTLRIAQGFDNTLGTLAAMGATTVQAGTLINQGGALQAAGAPISVTVDGLLDNSQHGSIASDGDLNLSAATLDNTVGTIQHAGSGNATISAANLNGHGGSIISNGSLTLTGTTTDLSGGATQAQRIRIDTGELSTASGSLQALSTDALQINARNRFDNTGGTIVTNGALALDAGALNNRAGTLVAAGADASQVQVTGLLDNSAGGTLATSGATTVHAGAIDNTAGALQFASTDALTLSSNGLFTNDHGTLLSNGEIDLTAGSLSNQRGTLQTQKAINAHIADTLDNTDGSLIAGGDLSITAQTLRNRDTLSTSANTGLYGQHVMLAATTLDNTNGQVQARDALTLSVDTLVNTGGVLDGTGTVQISGSTLDNSAGKIIQRGDSGSLALNLSQGLSNTNGGSIGAEGSASIHARRFDNSAGTTFALHDLSVTTDGDVINHDLGQLQANGNLALNAQGTLDNSGGLIDASNAASITANTVANIGGQVLAGNSTNPDASLQIASNTIDNRGGTLGNRGGDLVLHTASIDNSAGGTLVAQRNLSLDALNALNNAGGTTYATGNLSFQNANATLDNSGGQLGAGQTATLNLASITNANAGHINANTVSLTTAALNNDTGKIDGVNVQATLGSLNGLGLIYASNELDAHFTGNYTHQIGQRLESDGVLNLTVDGTLINQGTLQTAGELDITAANLINQGTINASNDNGTGSAHVTAAGLIDNQAGASIEGDTLTLDATDISNTSSKGIVGDVVQINANTLTNGRDLGTADAAVAYGEGFIGASQYLDLRIAQHLANLDGDIYSGGGLNIAGRTDGTRVATLDNVSGRIQADGDGNIAADTINNRRRFVETAQYTLSTDEAYALSSDRAYDNALSPTEQQRLQQLFAIDNRTTAQINELLGYLYRTGWTHVDHVSDADLATLNARYNQIAIDKYGQRGGYLVVGANGNPGNEVKQTDTYLTGTRITRESADAQILTGGDLRIDLGTHLTNVASTIVATGDLTISGQAYDGSPDARIDNIAIAGQYTVQRDIESLIINPVAAKYLSSNGWKDAMVVFDAHLSTDTITQAGPALAAATISGRNVSINGRDVTNTAVQTGAGINTLDVGGLSGPESHSTGDARNAQAGTAGATNGAEGNAAQGAGGADRANGQAANGAGKVADASGARAQGGPGANTAQGQTVHGAGTATGAAAQTVGSAGTPLPGYVPPSNGKYSQNGDPGAPFLVNTAPRFAKGPVTSSDYLLRALGDDPSNIHKRLGDGYYEQNLVLDQLLQLTGRRTINGGDGLSQYTALMDSAANEAARLGLQLGAPLTTEQIGALSSDIVWLVDQVVNGEHVLAPVVYLSQSTADQLRNDGALIAGDNVNIQASGTLRNDGTITGTQSITLSADTLINRGSINGGQQLAIATAHDTINQGSLSANAIGITAGGSVINAPAFDGIVAKGGTITAGTGGLQITAVNDVINQGKIVSAGDGVIVAGRDYVQNAAVAGNTAHAAAGSLTTAGNAIVIAGRDAVFDQSTVTAGKVAYIDAGRDAHFTAATISGGAGLAVKAGQDIVSDTVTDHVVATDYTKQGKNWSSTVTTEDTVRGSTFTSGGDTSMQAGRDVNLTAATVKADGAIGVTAGRDVNLTTAQSSATSTTDSYTKQGKVKTTTHSETTDTLDVGTTLQAGKGVAIVAAQDINAKAAQIDGGQGAVQMGAGRDINLTVGQATHTESEDISAKKSGFWSKAKTTSHSDSTDTAVIGTTINGDGVAMVAGRDVHATSAQISANDGAAVLVAGRDLTLDTASDTHESNSTTTSKGAKINSADRGAALAGVPAGLLTRKKTTTTTTHEASTDAVSTTVTGDSVSMSAGRDMTLNAVQIGATHDVTAVAGNNLTVGVATNTYEASQSQSKKKTGLQESGGSVMYGQSKNAQTNTITQTTPQGSLIGSTDGRVTMAAGNNMHLTDATVLSNTGTTLVAKNVTIDAAMGSTDITQTQKQSSAGIKAGLSGGAASAAMGADQSAKRGNEVKDDRLKALYAAQAGYGASDSYQAVANGDSTGGASLRIGIGASSASTKTSSHDDTAYGSSIRSNGNVIIAATDGDLNVIGSQISGDNVALAASNAINLRSQEEDHTLDSRNKNGSGEVGFSVGSQTGWYVSASAGKGSGNGNGTTHANTHVNANNTLSLTSGGDTTLEGAQATGKTVLADVGGNLSIRSLQDTNDFASKQTQAGGTFVYGYGGSANFSQGNTNSKYKSVTEVSGIGAGDGGYNIHVGGNTDLKGGVIASTADASMNVLDTGSLSFSDIENQAKYSASNIGMGGGNNRATGPSGIAPMVGIPQGDSSHNTTKAGIANGTIIVRNGDTDLSGLDRNAALDQPTLKPIFDQQKVQESQEMGQVAAYVGMRTAGTVADYMVNHATTEEEKAAWNDGGRNKVILHGLVGAGTAALSNGHVAGGALGAAVSEAASTKMLRYLDDQNITDEAERATFMNLASAAMGGVMGSGTGAATALQGEQFNRQLHKDEIEFVKDPDRIKRFAEANGLTEAQAAQELGRTAAASVDAGWDRAFSEADGNTQRARNFISSELAQSSSGSTLFQVTQNEYYNEKLGLPELMKDRDSLSYMLNTVAKVDPATYSTDPRYAQTIALAKGQGSNDGAGAAILNNAVALAHMGIGITDAIAYPENAWSNATNAWSNLQDTLQYKGMLDNLHLMQGDVYGVNYDNSRGSTELGVSLGIALGLPGILKDNPLHGPGVKPMAALDAEVPVTTSGGAANAATYQRLKDQLAREGLADIASQDPRLAAAVNGSGGANPNYPIGSGTASDADLLGKAWVGDGAKPTSGGGWISADGTRGYRPPTIKDSSFATTGEQANFETYSINPITGKSVKIGNGHLNVTK